MMNFSYVQIPKKISTAPLAIIKEKLGSWEIKEKKTAKRVVNLIPSQCPFARDVYLFNQKILTIPPLCKINPFYEDLMMLRFRALCFLSEIGEDITPYCQ
ncbi:Mo-dependent nitrogenase C-terminal domain-containing protein [Cyanobacterium stanieri LEGE 03274]|uniref:Mo-dependent nitrogenase C-terminal domain-containing protein n=1 Tax=Cyanobacterium stanieri LEGE 03274 TaxID=1828756 RepID=A0ABR9V4N0_9CHRO|nr:Mo-dependent nitrogenase C-terminal domain-containing protein [Cyanobacterium stanieri]MBE9222802.1 Mo-dependent nitrogenase C-terminal domain-containing protein [Cyanobacterium stanieri LEGE 03274]